MSDQGSLPDAPDFGRYTGPVLLGRGGMGAVYRATDPQLDRFVAIKVLTHSDPRYLERFRREAQLLAKVMHPTIIQIYEIVGGEGDGAKPYIVMEFFDGKPLDALLKPGPVPQADVMSILRQTADGLKRAHANNVVHRDIKPANIMVSAAGDVKILDFGIAKALDAKKDLTGETVLGTPYYMSPEQALGHTIDGRSDLYSLGITAFHLLSGKRPFEAKNKVDVMMMQLKVPLPDLRVVAPGLDERILALVERLAAKKAADRFQGCQELIDAIDDLPRSLGGRTPDAASLSQAASRAVTLTPGVGRPNGGAESAALKAASETAARLGAASVDARMARTPSSATGRQQALDAGGRGVGEKAATTPGRSPSNGPFGQSRPGNTSALSQSRPAIASALVPSRGGGEPAKGPQQAASRVSRPVLSTSGQAPPAQPARSPKTWLFVLAGVGLGLAAVGLGLWLFAVGRTGPQGDFRVPSKGWTHPAGSPPLARLRQEGNYGNCVFSSSLLEKGKEDAKAVRTQFAASEPIHARCYFARAVGTSQVGEVWQELRVDGRKVARILYDPPLPPEDDQLGFDFAEQHAARLESLQPGPHILDLWILRKPEESEQPQPLAAGELTIVK